jgi:rhodanese-related sulfurtransferase
MHHQPPTEGLNMTNGSVTQITPAQVADLVAAGAAFIDVREHQETAAGKAPGVTCIPLQSFAVEAVPTGRDVVLICRSGRRSDAVASALAGMGFTTYNVSGGMAAWQAAGLPIVTDDGGPGTVL